MKTKIALVGYRLNRGGAERVMATLSIFFDDQGFDVHNIIIIDDIGYAYSGKVLNLGKLKNKSNGVFNKIRRLRVLSAYLKTHNFDIIIDLRFRIKPIQELIIARLLFKSKTIFTVHSSSIESYMSKFTPLTKLTYAKCYKCVAVTKEVQKIIEQKHRLKNVTTIYNPINLKSIAEHALQNIDLSFEYIIGVGQMNTNVKQFDKLIIAYAKSVLPSKNIALVILGEGSKLEQLKTLACDNEVKHLVHFLGFESNPYKYLRCAKFFVLSSKFEGLPMVMLEALACGTPVVAFDCPTGPKEVIEHKFNGLLIENQNMNALVDGINIMATDHALYQKCKDNALKSVQKFGIEHVGKQWLNLINSTE